MRSSTRKGSGGAWAEELKPVGPTPRMIVFFYGGSEAVQLGKGRSGWGGGV